MMVDIDCELYLDFRDVKIWKKSLSDWSITVKSRPFDKWLFYKSEIFENEITVL